MSEVGLEVSPLADDDGAQGAARPPAAAVPGGGPGPGPRAAVLVPALRPASATHAVDGSNEDGDLKIIQDVK